MFKGIKVNKAKVFKGKYLTLRSYLTLIDIYIKINNLNRVNKYNKVIFIETYLGGLVFT
jgi:hypothetical protein